MHRFAGLTALIAMIVLNLAPTFRNGEEKCCNCPMSSCGCHETRLLSEEGWTKDSESDDCCLKGGCRPSETQFLSMTELWIPAFACDAPAVQESGVLLLPCPKWLYYDPNPFTPPPRLI